MNKKFDKRFSVITLLTLVIIQGLIIGHFVPAASGNVPAGVRVLVEGAPIHGTNGVMFGPDGNLYVASALGKEIIVMDPESGEILQRISGDGPQGPDDLAFGPDGSLYWTDIIQGNVGRMFPDGTVIKQFVAPGVNPITFSDDGRLFVALDFLGDALYELDPNLVDPPRLIATDLGMMNGMDWGPDGRLYGPIWTQGRIVSVSVDGPLDMHTVADGFALVAAVKFDSQGRLYTVAREFSPDFVGQVVKVDIDTGTKEVLANLEYGLDNLAFDSEDRLFVSSANDGFIKEVLPGGELRLVSPGGIILPYGVAVQPRDDGGESVHLADMWTIREFDGATGTQLNQQFSSIGATDLIGPMHVSSDDENEKNLVISSWFDGAVQVWNFEDAESVEEFPTPWPPMPWLPMAAIRFQGDVVVSELGSGSVVKASTGEPIASGLYVPMGMANTENDLFVSDWATGMIWQIVTNGAASMTPIASGLAGPEGLSFDIDGSLLVVESGAGRVSSIDLDTGKVSIIVEGLSIGEPAMVGTPPAGTFNDLDVGALGHIYVSGDVTNVIYRIGATQHITRTIEDLSDTAFRVPGKADKTRKKINSLLNVGQRLIDKGKLRSAKAILNVLRRRMDGSGQDWITDADAQQEILELLDALITKLYQQIG